MFVFSHPCQMSVPYGMMPVGQPRRDQLNTSWFSLALRRNLFDYQREMTTSRFQPSSPSVRQKLKEEFRTEPSLSCVSNDNQSDISVENCQQNLLTSKRMVSISSKSLTYNQSKFKRKLTDKVKPISKKTNTSKHSIRIGRQSQRSYETQTHASTDNYAQPNPSLIAIPVRTEHMTANIPSFVAVSQQLITTKRMHLLKRLVKSSIEEEQKYSFTSREEREKRKLA